ncbi:MAG: GGDEF domain-containing protein [Devosia sp.]|uniref:GGDEF domain-containing protein n=1 Tax=Devosia sp. TaxID=1871048 RepID=UPI0024CD7138|nr:GGDEF domain-containing protein [Devosia sp.]UYO00929.1 MAG: GGDEF domain-containing protein [Devosia sp.]
MIDNTTLQIGIAFSGASLTIALLIGWLNTRHERYLVHGSGGISLIVLGVAIMGLRSGSYDLLRTFLPYSLVVVGMALIYAGSRLFRDNSADLRSSIVLAVAVPLIMAVPFTLGYYGTGTIVLNVASGVIMLMCAREYWDGRAEGPIAMTANAVIYAVIAVSFLCCAAVLAWDGTWVMTSAADNWAENFNSIMTLVGFTGIGAITLTLHHARAARLHHAEANTDALTGVLNRRALFARFDENRLATGICVLMFDLDSFKQINDSRGHAHGDVVLQRFAGIARSILRPEDTVARVGGEEFCVVMAGLQRDAARAVAERVRGEFADLLIPINAEGDTASVSAGLAIGGKDETFSSVMRRADHALYKAKNGGRNQVQVAALRQVA